MKKLICCLMVLVASSVMTSCNKRSNVDNQPPTPTYDVTLEAKYLLAEYWGDEYSPGADNYSIIIAENKFLMDMGGTSLTEGSYYCLDIYAPVTENGNIPAGTYTLDMTESQKEWTIDAYCSALVVVDGNGNFIPDEEGLEFSEATLVIAENYAELTAVIEGKTHHVTYSGAFAKVDSTTGDGFIIHETTLMDDVVIEGDAALFAVEEIGTDMRYVYVFENYGEYGAGDGAMFMLEIAYVEGGNTITGTYNTADGTLRIGTYDAYGMWGSWYFNLIDGELLYSEYAAIRDGSVTFVQEGETCTMELNCRDVFGCSIKATMSGRCMSFRVEPEAMLQNLVR